MRRNFQHEEVVDKILIAASAAAIARVKGSLDESELRRAYAEIAKDPQPIRMLLQVAPRLHFADDAVTIGDVTLYRATEDALRSRWPKLFEWDVAMRDRAVRDIKDKMVAELTIAASEGRAEEVAAERLTATLGIVGILYQQLFSDWPIGGLLPSLGAGRISEYADGRTAFGPATFFESGLMQFPIGYLPAAMRGTAEVRLGEAIAARRRDDVSRRLLVALHWWASGSEPGPWAMRFSRYMTVFETLFGRKSERSRSGLTKRLASRVAAFVASDSARLGSVNDHFVRLYDLRSDTVHEGELGVEPAFVYDAMRMGATAIMYLARSTLTDDAEFHRHLDVMTSKGDVWIEYGHVNRLDPRR